MCVCDFNAELSRRKRERKRSNKLEEERSHDGVTNLEVEVYDVLPMKMRETFEDLTQEHDSCCLVHLLTTSEVFKQLAARHPGKASYISNVISSQGGLQSK